MTKTKKQLRAEAVERLKWFESSSDGDGYYWDVTRAVLGRRPTEYDSSHELISALIDLLTDDDSTEMTVYNEASDDELFRCSYCHCKVYNIDMTEGDCGWGFTFCPQCGGEVCESDSRKIEAKLGEPTNGIGGGTNVISDDFPLVGEPPESDALEERNHLIAQARNSFKSLADNKLDVDRMRKGCRIAAERMDEEMKRMGIALDGMSIEPTNGMDEITANRLIGKSDAQKSAENAGIGATKGDIRNFDDSHAKLEADMERWLRNRFSDVSDSTLGVALSFLGRAAMAARREDLGYIDGQQRRIAELEGVISVIEREIAAFRHVDAERGGAS